MAAGVLGIASTDNNEKHEEMIFSDASFLGMSNFFQETPLSHISLARTGSYAHLKQLLAKE